MNKPSLHILFSVMAVTSMQAKAQVVTTESVRTQLTSPQGVSEVCQIPKKLQGVLADQSDFSAKDLKTEQELCAINFYENVGICPKLNSTNPGVLISRLPKGMDKATFESKHCRDNDPMQKIEAKFKQSITCSYTPSGLAAYQISRLLGGAGRVPVAVIRTMDKNEHEKVTNKALALLGQTSQVIGTTWKQMKQAHGANPLSRNLFAGDGQMYGFLSENPRGEDRYTEVSGTGDYETRYERFLKQTPFQRVSSAESVAELAGSQELSKVLPVLVQMKDVSDMVLLDTLLSQDDRIGNIHFRFRWYYLENGKLAKAKSEAVRAVKKEEIAKANYRNGDIAAQVPPEELEAMKAKNAVLVKEIILKDNDCGVDVKRRSNGMRRISALEKVRHMSFETYANFMRFAKFIQQNREAAKEYFTKELLYTPSDFEGHNISFMSNLELAEKVLSKNCKDGSLKLDLDLDGYLPGRQRPSITCDIN